MKQIASNRSVQPPSVNLYRDDLEEIIDIISGSCENIRIDDGKYIYDSLDELSKAKGSRVRVINIRGTNPLIILSLNRFNNGQIFFYGSDSGLAVFHKIQGILNKRKSLLAKIFDIKICFVLFIIYFIMMISKDITGLTLWKPLLIFFILFSSFILSFLMQVGLFSSINLSLRHETTTFWSRNAERIFSGIIGAFLLAIIKIAIDYVIKLYFK